MKHKTISKFRKIRGVRYDQEFHYRGAIWRVLSKDIFFRKCIGSCFLFPIKSRDGKLAWINRDKIVEVVVDQLS